jgi:lipopolysaccharide transport system permease protein
MFSYLSGFTTSRELLLNLTLREVRGKYKRTALGQLWSLANPFAAMLVYTFVFSFVFRVNPPPGNPSGLDSFPLWLLCGLIPWMFLSGVLNAGAVSLVNSAGLIQKVYFFRPVLPLSFVFSIAYNWLFEMGVLIIVLLIAGSFIWPWLPLLILTMVILTVFAAGLAFLLAIANVYFRDTEHILILALQIWMYMTPIIYPLTLVAEQSNKVGGLLGTSITVLDIYRLNPMERFVSVFRSMLYDNTWPHPEDFLYVVVCAVISLSLGLWIFQRNEKGLAEAI